MHFTKRADQAKALVESVPHDERGHVLERISAMPNMEDVAYYLVNHWGIAAPSANDNSGAMELV